MIRFFAVIIHVLILSLCLSKGWARNVHNSFVLKPLQSSLQTPIEKPALLVVHASTDFDKNMLAKQGIDKLIKSFKSKKLPVIYLVSDLSKAGQARWYTDDRNPDFVIYSTAGEHNLPLSNADITVVGGFWGSRDGARGCHSLALRNVIQSYFFWQHKQTPLRLHLPLSAIYFFNSDEVLKKTTLKELNKPNLWSEGLLNSLLTQTAADDRYELAQPFLSVRSIETVPNIFQEGQSEPMESKIETVMNFADGTQSNVTYTAEGQYLTTPDLRYVEGPTVDTKAFHFQMGNSSRSGFEMGSGSNRVQFLIEK